MTDFVKVLPKSTVASEPDLDEHNVPGPSGLGNQNEHFGLRNGLKIIHFFGRFSYFMTFFNSD